jgi:hypothetical protein
MLHTTQTSYKYFKKLTWQGLVVFGSALVKYIYIYIYYSMTTRSLATLTLCGVRVALFMENMTENYLEHK